MNRRNPPSNLSMTISVIIPTFNEETTLAHTLSQTSGLNMDEVIVVDGGSTDRTLAMASAFMARVATASLVTAPQGRAKQMNEGVKASRGEILLFLHADTELPATAREMIERALAIPGTVGGRFDVRFASPSPWARIVSALMNWRSRLSGIATGDQAIFVRREVFDRLGGFPDIPLMEDVEFSRRLKAAGRMVALRQTVTTSFRRWERQGPMRTILLMWTLRLLYWLGISPWRLSAWYAAIR
jgi:rSAM/selenodomain-associated transferase 2